MKWNDKHRQYAAKRHHKRPGLRLTVMATVVIFVAMAIAGVLYYVKHRDAQSGKDTTFTTRMTAWVSEHHKPKEKKPVVRKKVVAKKDEFETKIHFEFYKSLPKAEMPGMKSNHEVPVSHQLAVAEQLERELYEAAKGKQSREGN